jgi:hypothetical protein
MAKENNHTPTGIRIVGSYENERNAEASNLIKDILREVFQCGDVIVAHHLVYIVTEHRDGFEYQIVEEIPAVDTLIFEHRIAKKLWGDQWQDVLIQLALEPVATRDRLLAKLYYGRNK